MARSVNVRSYRRKGRPVAAYSRQDFRMGIRSPKNGLSLHVAGFGAPRGPKATVPKQPDYLIADVRGHHVGKFKAVRKDSLGKFRVSNGLSLAQRDKANLDHFARTMRNPGAARRQEEREMAEREAARAAAASTFSSFN